MSRRFTTPTPKDETVDYNGMMTDRPYVVSKAELIYTGMIVVKPSLHTEISDDILLNVSDIPMPTVVVAYQHWRFKPAHVTAGVEFVP